MATIKQKADKIREAIAPFLDLNEALQEIADLAADEQAVREATKNLGALKAEILRLGDEKVMVMSEIARLNEYKQDALAALSTEGDERIQIANDAAVKIAEDAEASAAEILREAKETANAISQEVSALADRKAKLEIEVDALSNKLETIRESISKIIGA